MHCDRDSVITGGLIFKYIMDRGMDIHASTPYIHHQNGQVEQAMQTVLDKTRTLLYASQAPLHYWDYALEKAAYLIQRTPNSHNKLTPYEILTGKKPVINQLVHFFAPGVYHLTKEGPKAKLCRMSSSEHHKDLLQFEPDIETVDGKLVGDEVAPYFALTPEEYQDQADRDEDEINEIRAESGDSAAYFGLTSEQYEELVRRDQNNANAVLECYFNDFALSVHAPLALPPDPISYEAAVGGWDGAEWRAAVDKELSNFNSRDIVREAPQDDKAMKTKLVLKYTYTENYELKSKARLVVCGYSQIPGVDFQETYAPTTNNIVTSIVCQVCTAMDLFMATFDVTGAFLEGTADRRLFARLPSCISATNQRVEIIGNWYGGCSRGRRTHGLFTRRRVRHLSGRVQGARD
jgi:hypothetical protein